MLRFLLKVLLMAGVFFLVTQLLDGVQVVGNPDAPLGEAGTYLWISLLFALVNAIVGPLLRLISFPVVLLTLGLFLLLVNAALLGITAALTDRLAVDGFGSAVLGGLLLAVGGWLADRIVESK